MRKWIENNGCYELHFTPFHEDIVLIKFAPDKADSTCWWYVSDILNVEQDCIFEDNIDDAKEEFEEMIASYYEDQISYYEELLSEYNRE